MICKEQPQIPPLRVRDDRAEERDDNGEGRDDKGEESSDHYARGSMVQTAAKEMSRAMRKRMATKRRCFHERGRRGGIGFGHIGSGHIGFGDIGFGEWSAPRSRGWWERLGKLIG